MATGGATSGNDACCLRGLAAGRITAFDGKSGPDPLLFPAYEVFDVRVTHRRQFPGGVARGVSGGAAAVDDNLGILVRKHAGSELTHAIIRDIDRAGQVRVGEFIGRQCFYQREMFVLIDFPLQLIARDVIGHNRRDAGGRVRG